MMPVNLRRTALVLYVGLVLVFLIVPVLIIIPMSFSDSRFLSFPPPAYSLRWYEAFFGSSAWMAAARTSLLVAMGSTVIATPLGIAAAYAIASSQWRIMRFLRVVLLLPIIVPVIIIAAGVYFIFAEVGLLFTLPGLILANVMLSLPFVVTAVTAGLEGFDFTQERVARSLGMNRFRAFMTVTLPQVRPSVISGAVFAFIWSLDETIVALFISGGRNSTLTKQMFTSLRDEIDPTIAAVSALLTFTSILAAMLVFLMNRKR